MKGKILLAERISLPEVRGPDEAPVEGIGPGMVRATHGALEASFLAGAQTGPAVPADVVEGAQATLAIAQDENALLADPQGEIIAGLPEPFLPSGAQPGATEDLLPLALQDIRVAIGLPGQSRLEPHLVPGHSASHCPSP